MCKTFKTYTSIILFVAMLLAMLPTYAFGLEVPSGYKQSTKAGSKISTDVYLTTHEKPDTEDPDKNIEYTVEFYLQNIENDNYTQDINSTKELNGRENDTITINKNNAPKFSGFTLNEDKGITSGQLSSKNELTIKLYYDRNLINVSIDPDNEAGNKDEKIIKYGSKVEKPVPEKGKDGYKFNGWVDEDGNTFDFTKPILKDTVISPSWLPDTSSGDGDNTGNTGDNNGDKDKPNKPGDGNNNGEDNKPNDGSEQYQYVINYWYDNELEQVKGSGNLGDLTPYDLTTPVKHNGKNYVLESFKVTKFITDDSSKNITEIYFTLDVKDKNSNDALDGDGVPDKYQTSSNKYNSTDTFGYEVNYNYKDNMTVTSQVTEKGKGTVGTVIPYSYSTTINKNEQKYILDSLVVNSNIITPDEADNTVEVNYTLLEEGQKVPTDSVSYMVSVDPDNNTKIYTYFVKAGEILPTLDIPEKTGYVFTGWVENDGSPFDLNSPINSNKAIKAVWELKDNAAEYKVSHYTPTKQADNSQEFKGFELITTDVYAGEIGSQVQAIVKNWSGFKVDNGNVNTVMSGIVADGDKQLVLRVFYISDSGNTTGGNSSGSGSSGGSGGSGGTGGGSKPSGNKPNDSSQGSAVNKPEHLEALVELDNVNHIAYIRGYEDGTMRPNNSITRGEVAEIVYRLMMEDYRNEHYTLENSFSDVSKDIWCNASISTDAQAGILLGYEDGEFKYNNSITRAEFAAIVSRFFTNYSDVQSDFIDIEGHWAEKYINNVASAGWITGYADKTFRPDNFISRAEAVTIINRVLNRNVDEDGLLEEMKRWPDVNEAAWYYFDIQEAGNAHTYSTSNGTEYWQSIID